MKVTNFEIKKENEFYTIYVNESEFERFEIRENIKIFAKGYYDSDYELSLWCENEELFFFDEEFNKIFKYEERKL